MPRPKPLWRCPKCGHRFVTKNLWHSCGNYRLADHFKGKPAVIRETFDAFSKLVRGMGPVTIYAEKTRIVCMVRARFAGAIARTKWLECGMWLRRKAEHPRLHKIEQYGPDSFGHKFRFDGPEQLDEAFARLLREAYRTTAVSR